MAFRVYYICVSFVVCGAESARVVVEAHRAFRRERERKKEKELVVEGGGGKKN